MCLCLFSPSPVAAAAYGRWRFWCYSCTAYSPEPLSFFDYLALDRSSLPPPLLPVFCFSLSENKNVITKKSLHPFLQEGPINKTIFNIEDSRKGNGSGSSPELWRHPSSSCTPIAPLDPSPSGSSHCSWACTGRSWNHCMMRPATAFNAVGDFKVVHVLS